MLKMRTQPSTSPIRRAGLVALSMAMLAGYYVTDADARPGRGGSVGSRGDRTFSAPPTTNTAPKPAAPMERSMTQPGKPSAAAPAAAGAATAAAQTAAKPNMMRNLLMGGLIGAGLATMFGMGGGLAAVLGFMLQALLIGGLIFLAVAFFRSRMQPASAPAQGGSGPGRGNPQPMNAGMGATAARTGAMAAAPSAVVAIQPADFDAFERLLNEIQTAYGNEDVDGIGDRTTPEMLSYFAGELADNKRNGVVNKISGIKLLQGDLAESWAERGSEYATVAMRYAITDVTNDRATGRVVDGSTTPTEATEVWTFLRRAGQDASGWQLSAIQQA